MATTTKTKTKTYQKGELLKIVCPSWWLIRDKCKECVFKGNPVKCSKNKSISKLFEDCTCWNGDYYFKEK